MSRPLRAVAPPSASDDPSVPPAIWAGFECALVRVGDRIVDQLVLTGHGRRIRDIDRLAALGVEAVRYPVLWERRTKHGARRATAWSDRRLARLERHGIDPIVALFHHGTGLRGEVLDPGFPAAFAAYAREVAERHPSVRSWLPINEIATNAKFCGLYGHWYPHHRDPRTFTRILLHQVLAFRAAARALRAVRSDARILVAEDVGTTRGTRRMEYQASFDRERRWLVLDLLHGRRPREDVLQWLCATSDERAMVDGILAEPCPPDIVGVNRYLTSDRFLDERVERYPQWTWGTNGRERYADVELVRVSRAGLPSWQGAIEEVWGRYGTPIALTEVHVAGDVEERIAWWSEAWQGACAAAAAGVPVLGVTSWAVMGSWDWPALLTRPVGIYEAGIWDTSGGRPAATALGPTIARLARGIMPPRPAAPPWWRRDDRLLYPPVEPAPTPDPLARSSA